MKTEILVAIVAAVAGGAGAVIAFIGVFLTNREQGKRQRAQFEHDRKIKAEEVLRERKEELYVLLYKWSNDVFL